MNENINNVHDNFKDIREKFKVSKKDFMIILNFDLIKQFQYYFVHNNADMII